ncbi:MAG: hypothetical protein V4812_18545 [Pseudomonadota bacterium]
MAEESDFTYGLISMNMVSAQYTAILRDKSVSKIDNYESIDSGMPSEKHIYQAYRVKAVIVEQIHGKLPKEIEYIAHHFQNKKLSNSECPLFIQLL